MRVGVIGSGEVGEALARGFASRGHDVTIGSRNPEKLASFAAESGGKIKAGTLEEAAAFGEILALATLGEAAEAALKLCGLANVDGKVLIDVTNPLKFEEGKKPEAYVGFDDSLGERVQRAVPGAKVVKAFNTVGNPFFADPKLPGGPPTMFIAGNDAGAKKTVTQILESFGWDVVDAGGIEESRQLESLAILWIHTGINTGNFNIAFKLLRA